MNEFNADSLDWQKMNGLLPATVQNASTGRVLMTGYMNPEALDVTRKTKRVTFWSRSRNELWTKGDTSGNFLDLIEIGADCDNDALLVLAEPHGPTCHLGAESCFGDIRTSSTFLGELDNIIADRKASPRDGSYTKSMFDAGIQRIAQKVGEEGVETALAAIANDDAELLGEVGDLFYHALVLLQARNLRLSDVCSLLESRHR